MCGRVIHPGASLWARRSRFTSRESSATRGRVTVHFKSREGLVFRARRGCSCAANKACSVTTARPPEPDPSARAYGEGTHPVGLVRRSCRPLKPALPSRRIWARDGHQRDPPELRSEGHERQTRRTGHCLLQSARVPERCAEPFQAGGCLQVRLQVRHLKASVRLGPCVWRCVQFARCAGRVSLSAQVGHAQRATVRQEL